MLKWLYHTAPYVPWLVKVSLESYVILRMTIGSNARRDAREKACRKVKDTCDDDDDDNPCREPIRLCTSSV